MHRAWPGVAGSRLTRKAYCDADSIQRFLIAVFEAEGWLKAEERVEIERDLRQAIEQRFA